MDPDACSKKEKQKAPNAYTLLKEKQCGNLRAGKVADGRPQWAYVPREEAAPPTVNEEALMVTLLIDAKEKCDVAIFNIPSAYLHTYMSKHKKMVLKFVGKFIEIMCEVDPRYKRYVRIEGGTKVFYTRIVKALYGCLESALLWYKVYSGVLKEMASH